jgi:hypothetical protein
MSLLKKINDSNLVHYLEDNRSGDDYGVSVELEVEYSDDKLLYELEDRPEPFEMPIGEDLSKRMEEGKNYELRLVFDLKKSKMNMTIQEVTYDQGNAVHGDPFYEQEIEGFDCEMPLQLQQAMTLFEAIYNDVKQDNGQEKIDVNPDGVFTIVYF